MTDETLHSNPLQPEPKPSPHRWYRQLPVSALTAIAAVLLATGSATAWWTWQTISARQEAAQQPIPEAAIPITPDPTDGAPGTTTSPLDPAAEPVPSSTAEQVSVQVYWLKDTGTQLELVPATLMLEAGRSPESQLQQAFEYLLNDTNATDGAEESGAIASTIPANTHLNSVEIDAEGIHVDLSAEFTLGGGSASMGGRLGQVIYTATTLDAEAPVWLSIDGTPLELLGGEGLMVSQPMTRAEFDKEFSL